jgi:hypothetical protein
MRTLLRYFTILFGAIALGLGLAQGLSSPGYDGLGVAVMVAKVGGIVCAFALTLTLRRRPGFWLAFAGTIGFVVCGAWSAVLTGGSVGATASPLMLTAPSIRQVADIPDAGRIILLVWAAAFSLIVLAAVRVPGSAPDRARRGGPIPLFQGSRRRAA